MRIQDDLLYSDFYPLTEYSLENDVWMAFQFDRPAAGSGVVLAFRRPHARTATMRFTLHGLDAGTAVQDRQLRPEWHGTVVRKEPDAAGPGDFAFGRASLGHRAVRAPVRRVVVISHTTGRISFGTMLLAPEP